MAVEGRGGREVKGGRCEGDGCMWVEVDRGEEVYGSRGG